MQRKMSISKKVLIELKNWLFVLSDKIAKNPGDNFSVLGVSAFVIAIFGVILYKSFGVIPMAGYILACLVGISKILDDIKRPLAWGAGYFIVEVISKIMLKLIQEWIPNLKAGNNFTSIPFILIVFYILSKLLSKAEPLKKI